jgi:hypothetical protein
MENVFIYALSDPRNNQVRYIGKANNPEDRYTNHFNSSRDKNTHKRNWINSVRKDGLRPELIIIDEVPKSEWIYWEKFYISLFKTWGFSLVNYTEGGDGSTFGNKGSWKKGNTPHNKGVPCREEIKQKIKNKLIGVPNVASYKPIIKYDLEYRLIKKYKCIKDVVTESDGYFNHSSISSCLTGKRVHYKGFIWKYDDGSEIVMKDVKLLKKPVIQYDLTLNELNKFDSIKEASKKTKVAENGIVRCCKGEYLTAGNFIWRYNDDIELSIRENKKKKSVIQYDKSLIQLNRFNSITEASIKTEISINSIWSCCKGINKIGGGYIWKYENQ